MDMKYWLLSILLLLSFNTVWADEAVCKKLTIDEAISIAVDKNLDISKRRKDFDIATNNIKIANRLQNPQIQSIFFYGEASIGNPNQVGLAQPIEIMKRGPRKNLAKAQKTLTTSSINSDVFNLKMNVRTAYINYASSKSILKVVQKQQEYLKDMVAIASRKVFVGLVPETEYMRAKIILDQLTTVYNQALTQVEVDRYNFNKAINVDEAFVEYDIVDDELPHNMEFIRLYTPDPKSDLPSCEEFEKIAFQNRNDIKIARNELEVAKRNLIVVMRQKVPDVTVLGGYLYWTPRQDFGRANPRYVSGAYAGLNVDLPVLYRYRPEINNAKIEIEKKELNLRSVENIAKQNIKIAYDKFLVAQENLNYYTDELLQRSLNVVKSSRRSYEVGKSQLSDLILTQQSNMEIMMGYILALTDYYLAWIDLLRELSVEGIS